MSTSFDSSHSSKPSGQEAINSTGDVFNRPENPHRRPWVFTMEDAIKKLPSIDRMIRELSNLPTYERQLEDDFESRTIRHGPNKDQTYWIVKDNSRFDHCRAAIRTLAKLEKTHFNLSMYARVFLFHFRWCFMEPYNDRNLTFYSFHANTVSQNLKKSIDNLVNETSSPYFKRKKKESEELSRKRATSLKKWMRQVFRHTPKILWVQLHLGYKKPNLVNINKNLEDRSLFLKKMRKSTLTRHLTGYVGKLIYHPEKGMINDIIFLYDARYVKELSTLTQTFSNLWEKVTEKEGLVWTEGEPAFPKAPRINGIWSQEDKEQKEMLNQLIHYLSYYDNFIQYNMPSHTRTLIKSQAPTSQKKTSRKKTKENRKPASDADA